MPRFAAPAPALAPAPAPAPAPATTAGAAEPRVKLSAAWLIERCGMPRGYTDAAHGGGRAGLSSRHTLALVNRGGASAADVVSFARHVRDRVRAACGVTLRPEPLFVGFGVSPGELPDRG
jgi:UDP-N-acetylmuramate dehydrogenase